VKRPIAVTLAVLLATGNLFQACSRAPHEDAATALSLPVPPDGASAGTIAETPPTPADFDAAADSAASLRKSLAIERYDFDAGARALGSGYEPAFRFVRDEVQYDAYAGVLRGASNAFTARAANSFDRALLLSDLLKRKGLRTRFAIGRLARADAERLFDHAFDRARLVLGAPAAGERAAAASEGSMVPRVRSRAMRDYAAIRAALGGEGPRDATMPRDAVVAEITPHAWVQTLVDGRWVDLDPSFPDATSGKAFTNPDRVADDLPGEFFQTVNIRVIVDALNGSSLTQSTALDVRLPAAELIDRQVVLFHKPTGGLPIAGAIAAAVEQDAWHPTLWVDGRFYDGSAVHFSDRAAPSERGRPPGGGFGGLFGSGGALAATHVTVREWIEIDLATPGRAHEITRRTLLDRAHGAAPGSAPPPNALAPIEQNADGPIAPRTIYALWFSAGRHDLAGYADAVAHARAVAARDGDTPQKPGGFGEAVWPLTIAAAGFFIFSDHVTLQAIDDATDCRLYPDSPRVAIVAFAPAADGVHVTYDLRRDALRAVARTDRGREDAIRRKLWFGALEGALEHEIGVNFAALANAPSSAVVSTSALLDGKPSLAMIPPERGPDWLARAAAPGTIALVPSRAAETHTAAWWEISRTNADTRAVLASMNGMDYFNSTRGSLNRPSVSTHYVDPETMEGSRSSPFSVRKEPERKPSMMEYFLVISMIVISVVAGGKVLVGFWRTVLVPTFSGTVTDAMNADRRPHPFRDQ
jgi:transglutaminase superfamily protein